MAALREVSPRSDAVAETHMTRRARRQQILQSPRLSVGSKVSSPRSGGSSKELQGKGGRRGAARDQLAQSSELAEDAAFGSEGAEEPLEGVVLGSDLVSSRLGGSRLGEAGSQ